MMTSLPPTLNQSSHTTNRKKDSLLISTDSPLKRKDLKINMII